jgi:hypothetical protein
MYHGDPRLVADECGARERPEKNAACSHFLHDITARSFPDATVSVAIAVTARECRHDEKAFDYGRDRGTIFPAFRRKCTGAAW